MEWWLRFCLGLPCRKEDVEAIYRYFPEIQNPDFRLQPNYVWPFFPYFDDVDELPNRIREWTSSIDENRHQSSNAVASCPEPNCPIKKGNLQSDTSSSAKVISDEPDILLFLTIGGFQKSPKDDFLDLVRKHHASVKTVKEVIVTDPYYLSDVSEDGAIGGYDNMISYLKALSLDKTSVFKLTTNPSPKFFSNNSKQIFQDTVKKDFPKISFGTYDPKYKFHDRLYLVRDDRSEITGVFGPSMNGLSSNSIVLMGDINQKALLSLKSIFQ
jgi:hypothetical protein